MVRGSNSPIAHVFLRLDVDFAAGRDAPLDRHQFIVELLVVWVEVNHPVLQLGAERPERLGPAVLELLRPEWPTSSHELRDFKSLLLHSVVDACPDASDVDDKRYRSYAVVPAGNDDE